MIDSRSIRVRTRTRTEAWYRGLFEMLRSSTAIFVGRLDGRADVPEPLPSMLRGTPDAFVTRVLKGTLRVGERVRVR